MTRATEAGLTAMRVQHAAGAAMTTLLTRYTTRSWHLHLTCPVSARRKRSEDVHTVEQQRVGIEAAFRGESQNCIV